MTRTAFGSLRSARVRWTLLALALAGGGALRAGDRPPLVMAPDSPAYTDWTRTRQAGPQRTADGHALGHVPSPVDLSHLTGSVFPASSRATFPAAYDLRPGKGLGLSTPVRDQNPYGTCWSFGALGSLESSLLVGGYGTWNLSEWHLAWFAYNDLSSAMPAFTKNASGGDETFDLGGNNGQSVALLSRGTGAVAEADCPYQNVSPYPVSTRPTGTETNRIALKHAYFLGSAFSASNVKTALMAHGAVSIPIFWSDASYSAGTHAYRYTATGSTNHIVTVVGWDDAYAATNFPASNRPASNGAWIVKNSWGTWWGDAGYFYLSYDSYIHSGVSFVGDPQPPARTYQVDPLGWVSSVGFAEPTAHLCNMFTAAGAENLTGVGFYTNDVNTAFELTVRMDPTGDPTTGTLVLGPQTGVLETPGYHTLPLASAVPLAAGRKFAVILKLTTSGYGYPVAVEYAKAGYTDKATAQAGQSWVASTGADWFDLTGYSATMNVCLKAFARPRGAADLTGDGKRDLLWRNASSGMVYVMPMDGATVKPCFMAHVEENPSWKIVAQADLDGDGRADLIWYHTPTGQVFGMLMGDGAVKAMGPVYQEPDTAWRIQAVADFDGDGKADLLWRNGTTGMVYVMTLDGLGRKGGAVVWTEADPHWRIVAADDFTGDGKADILWWNDTTGLVYLFRMDGASVASAGAIHVEPDTRWRIVGSADLDGDGTADLLWRHMTSGAVYRMPMSAGVPQAGSILWTEADASWQLADLGDFDGDGKADLLWRNSVTGQLYQMLMDGGAVRSGAMIYTEPDLAWSLQATRATPLLVP